ncbi:hypothetical protein LABF186_10000 [Lactobacillus amylovorus subsp. animalium]|uniref:Uncharacterized protein n=1 Tax=Lactobacillus amylovorus subsp. animalium TaxID=3378536 RepID=A0ABD0C3M8_LACAM|nr:hypothetical protein LABF186_10000 [Lactobacillus amylovorus]GMM15716.1 hypothetical protein LABF125_08490 [Lactobacillus amylovorus]
MKLRWSGKKDLTRKKVSFLACAKIITGIKIIKLLTLNFLIAFSEIRKRVIVTINTKGEVIFANNW